MTPDAEAWFNVLWIYRIEVLSIVLSLAILELLWVQLRLDGKYSLKEMFANLAILFVGQGSRKLTYVFRLAVIATFYELSPLRIETTISSAVACYFGVDFLYYWKHRWLHETELGWAMHSVHHSSPELNLATSIRSSWLQRLIDDFFYVPLAALGFHPVVVTVLADLNLFSQFWVHTRTVGRLGVLDGFLNTPSNHRVHHAVSASLHHRNYGSTLIIWDRIFGTYTPEPAAEPEYGTEAGDLGHNPLRIQLWPLWAYVRARRARSLVAKATPPEDSPKIAASTGNAIQGLIHGPASSRADDQ